MPVGDGAMRRMRSQIIAKPAFLRRSGVTAANLFAVAVKNDDVPCAKLVTVIAGPRITGSRAEVGKIGRRVLGVVLMIARRWTGAASEQTPGRAVTLCEVMLATVGVREIAQSKNGTWNPPEQRGCGPSATEVVAARDVTRPDQNFRFRSRQREVKQTQENPRSQRIRAGHEGRRYQVLFDVRMTLW